VDESTAGPLQPAGHEPHRPEETADEPLFGEAGLDTPGSALDHVWWGDHDLPGTHDPYDPPTDASSPFAFEPDPIEIAEPRPRLWAPALLAGVLASALTVAGLFLVGAFDRDEVAAPAGTPEIVQVREIVTEGGEGSTAAAVGRKVRPSIVTIEVGTAEGEGFTQFGVGSGVVLSIDGLIVTNQHVIDDAQAVRVVLQDGTTYEAEIVGSDESTDLALLRIGGRGLVPIEVGRSEELVIGDTAIAVGNPLGLRGGASLTVGVVSAFDREVTAAGASTLFGMLQTDAPITQGSSGGALVDELGRLVGITTAIGVSTAGAEGIGFAIPVELMTRITEELVDDGAVRHAFLGVELQNQLDERPDGGLVPAGALVARLAEVEGSGAAGAGVAAGDVIVGFEGTDVTTREQLISALRRLRVGDEVTVDVRRNGEELSLDVVLGENLTDP
jgi:putative serine protease PepD